MPLLVDRRSSAEGEAIVLNRSLFANFLVLLDNIRLYRIFTASIFGKHQYGVIVYFEYGEN